MLRSSPKLIREKHQQFLHDFQSQFPDGPLPFWGNLAIGVLPFHVRDVVTNFDVLFLVSNVQSVMNIHM